MSKPTIDAGSILSLPSKATAHRPKRILVAYSMTATFVSTTVEYLLALKNFSPTKSIIFTRRTTPVFDINDYDVVFHNYCARLCFDGFVSEDYQTALLAEAGD
jgi:hypothetical protein